jgi:hypothetical protein
MLSIMGFERLLTYQGADYAFYIAGDHNGQLDSFLSLELVVSFRYSLVFSL